MKKSLKNLFVSVCMLGCFVLWTLLICFVDVKAIGPRDSAVGFSAINKFVHNLTGVNMQLYNITDWLGLVPIIVALGFALLGLIQWIKRKKLKLVDYSIFILGGFYSAVIAVYILFETIVVNYRPVLINGYLEVSYPSSTTMLVMCVMPTAIMQLKTRIKNRVIKKIVIFSITAFIVFMVVGRLISGVHWVTDIVGGIMLSISLVTAYNTIANFKIKYIINMKFVKENIFMENIFSAILGVVCIMIGISNIRGNISLLHSYHRKRVSEEDRLPFGKLVGIGTIIIGVALILVGGLNFLANNLHENIYSFIADIVMIVGLVIGIGFNFYAMFKYNKGIF